MNGPMYKLAVFDIDGTLRSSGGCSISQTNMDALTKLKSKGIKVALATGRLIKAIGDELIDFGFDYYICVNGSCIFDRNLQLLYRDTMDLATIERMMDFFSYHDYALVLKYINGGKTICGERYMKRFHDTFFGKDRRPENNYQAGESEEPVGGICRIGIADIEHVRTVFPEISFSEALDGGYFDFTKVAISKAVAITQLCKAMNIDLSETVAFGDGYNDIEMLQCVGLGIAMGNAAQEVKDIADYVTDDVENDGVAKAIEKLVI